MPIPTAADLWYRRYPERLKRATIGWPLAAKGAYSILIDYMFTIGESSIPADDRALCEIIGCPLDDWQPVADLVRTKFTNGAGRLKHTFAAEEMTARETVTGKLSAGGKRGAKRRWQHRH